MTHGGRLVLFLIASASLGSAGIGRAADMDAAAVPASSGSGSGSSPGPGPGFDPADEAAGLPAPVPGRQVLLDSRFVVDSRQRTLRLSDIDPEQADIVREINRKPGTWQMYLLYTAEDLPDKFFHPGFAIRFKPRALPADLPPEQAAPATSPGAAPELRR